MNLMISKTTARPTSAAMRAVETIVHATGECALGHVLVARSGAGVCAILLGDEPHDLEADLAARFPKALLVANPAIVHADLAKLIDFVDKPSEGLRFALDMRDAVPAPRLGEASCDLSRTHRQLHAGGALDQPLRLAPCGRQRLRRKSDRTGHSMPSRGAQQWRPRGLPLGDRAQA